MLVALALTRAAPSDLAACASGDGPACVRASASASDPDRAVRLLVEGCVAGHRPACEALPEKVPSPSNHRLVEVCIASGGPACDVAAAREPTKSAMYCSIACTHAGAATCGDVDPGQGPAVEATWAEPVRDLRVVAPGRAVSSAPPGWPLDSPMNLDPDHLGLSDELRSIVEVGTRWLARDRAGQIWTGRVDGEAHVVEGPPLDRDDDLEALVLHGDLALAVSRQTVRWFDPATGRAVGEPIAIPLRYCTFATLSDDGRYLACSSLHTSSIVRLEGGRFAGRWEVAPTAPAATPVRRWVGRVGLGSNGVVQFAPMSPVQLEVVGFGGSTPLPVDPRGTFFTAWPENASFYAVAHAGEMASLPTPTRGPGWDWDIVLQPVASIEVQTAPRVEGTEVSAVASRMLGGVLAQATTDARGVARLEVPKGVRFVVIARAPDGRVAKVQPEPGAEKVRAPLAAPSSSGLVFRVVDEAGEPVRGARLGVAPALASDADGRLWLDEPPTRGRLDGGLSGPPGTEAAPESLWLWIGDREATAVRRGADYVLGTASVAVPDPLPSGAEVWALSGGERDKGAPADGGFVVDHLLAGRWTVVAWSLERGASIATVDLAVGQAARVTPEPGRTLRGVVVEPDGTPAVGLEITVLCGSGDLRLSRLNRIETWTRADGSFVAAGVVGPGPWEVTAHGHEWSVREDAMDGARIVAKRKE